jgi:hypothetical protein
VATPWFKAFAVQVDTAALAGKKKEKEKKSLAPCGSHRFPAQFDGSRISAATSST